MTKRKLQLHNYWVSSHFRHTIRHIITNEKKKNSLKKKVLDFLLEYCVIDHAIQVPSAPKRKKQSHETINFRYSNNLLAICVSIFKRKHCDKVVHIKGALSMWALRIFREKKIIFSISNSASTNTLDRINDY